MLYSNIWFLFYNIIAVINIIESKGYYERKLDKIENVENEFQDETKNYSEEFEEKIKIYSKEHFEDIRKLKDEFRNVVSSIHQEIIDNRKKVNNELHKNLKENIYLNLTKCFQIAQEVHQESINILLDITNCFTRGVENFNINLEKMKTNFNEFFKNMSILKNDSKDCVKQTRTKKEAIKAYYCSKKSLKSLRRSRNKNAINLPKERKNMKKNYEKFRKNLFNCQAIKNYQIFKNNYPNELMKILKCIEEEKKQIM